MYLSKKSTLIVVHGVRIEDIMYERAPASQTYKTQIPTDEMLYTRIPRVFTGLDSWPASSNLCCWNCDLVPEGRPAFIPANVSADDINCDVVGHFCTWNCAVSYVHDHYRAEERWDAINSIHTVAAIFSGRGLQIIPAAPKKTLMAKYCGDHGMSPQKWRELLAQVCNAFDCRSFKLDSIIENS